MTRKEQIKSAFPDKEAAYRETLRVLKKGGTFCGCFYIRGGCRRTDWFIEKLYVPRGFGSQPAGAAVRNVRRCNGFFR